MSTGESNDDDVNKEQAKTVVNAYHTLYTTQHDL